METVVTLTVNPTIDKSTSVDVVVPEDKLRCEAPRFDPGGGGINVSRVIHRLGGSSQAVYAAGGRNGAFLEELLNRESLTHHAVSVSDETRVNLMVLETSTGKQYRFGMPGPTLTDSEWEACLDAVFHRVEPPGFLVVSGGLAPGMPDDFFARAARRGRKTGIRVVVDTSGDALRKAAREGVHLMKPNLRELDQLVETEMGDEASVHRAARQLVDEGNSEIVVVSFGSGGALYVSEEETGRIHAPLVPIKSKVGAGDSMVGGTVLALARGHSLHEAVCHGVAAGSATVMTPGTELCHRKDVERLFEDLTNDSGPSRPPDYR